MPTFHQVLTLSDTEVTEVTPGRNHSGFDLTVQNVDESGNVYIGGANVSATNYGFKMEPGDAFSVELNPRNQLYVISDTDGTKCALLRVFLEDM